MTVMSGSLELLSACPVQHCHNKSDKTQWLQFSKLKTLTLKLLDKLQFLEEPNCSFNGLDSGKIFSSSFKPHRVTLHLILPTNYKHLYNYIKFTGAWISKLVFMVLCTKIKQILDLNRVGHNPY